MNPLGGMACEARCTNRWSKCTDSALEDEKTERQAAAAKAAEQAKEEKAAQDANQRVANFKESTRRQVQQSDEKDRSAFLNPSQYKALACAFEFSEPGVQGPRNWTVLFNESAQKIKNAVETTIDQTSISGVFIVYRKEDPSLRFAFSIGRLDGTILIEVFRAIDDERWAAERRFFASGTCRPVATAQRAF